MESLSVCKDFPGWGKRILLPIAELLLALFWQKTHSWVIMVRCQEEKPMAKASLHCHLGIGFAQAALSWR